MHCNKTASSTDYLPRIAFFAADRVANLSARFLGLALRLQLPIARGLSGEAPTTGPRQRLLTSASEI
jgi:hypothetical protein